MRTELITIVTDTTPLDGAFHMPEDRPVRGGVLLFHGNTMNFYVGAPALAAARAHGTRVRLPRVQPARPRHPEHPRFPHARRRRAAAHARRHR
jgi:hypothetical protein